MRVGWVYDPMFLLHQTGDCHVECPARLEVIARALRERGLLARLQPVKFRFASPAELAQVHDPAYVYLLQLACEQEFPFIGAEDTRLCPRSYDAAALAAGGVRAACDAVLDGRMERAFCAVRPPGHHAEPDRALGFCLLNNVALGAEHLIRDRQLSRVAIIDIDAHHGNGTQRIFASRSDVLYVSLHERPGSLPFPGTGEAHETGSGEGVGATRNIPLSRGSGDVVYRQAFEQQVLPALDRFRPEFLLISAGFDALASDPLSNLSLQPASFAWMTESLVDRAVQLAHGRVVSVLEGGYCLDQLGDAVCHHVQALLA